MFKFGADIKKTFESYLNSKLCLILILWVFQHKIFGEFCVHYSALLLLLELHCRYRVTKIVLKKFRGFSHILLRTTDSTTIFGR